jgi:hypothetical protein
MAIGNTDIGKCEKWVPRNLWERSTFAETNSTDAMIFVENTKQAEWSHSHKPSSQSQQRALYLRAACRISKPVKGVDLHNEFISAIK